MAKAFKFLAVQKGIKIHQYLDDWLVRARSHQICLQHTHTHSSLSGVRLASEERQIRTGAKQVFDFIGYQFDLMEDRVRPNQECWQTLQAKIKDHMTGLVCPVRKLMSLIGLRTATEKQVHLGRLHMRTIQWHLKNNWRIPETMEKVIPMPKSLHPHLKWWLEESNVLRGQPLHPLKNALHIFTDTSKEGCGADLNEYTAREDWSLPESKLHINYQELKVFFLALKEFQDLCSNNIVLIPTGNTTVVAYINKEGGMKSGPLCALRILTWYARKQVILKARHIPGRLNVIAEKLSRLGQTIQTEWSLHPELFKATGGTNPVWTCLPPDSTTNCYSLSHQSQTPRLGQQVPGPQAFPPAAILGKVVEKLQDYPCSTIILIAPGWPNMPWFWDLVTMSSQIPLCLPNLLNLVTQPFNQALHRNLTNLNLHAWLLEPQLSRSRASLRQWQYVAIEAQRGSTRSVYEAKWTIFTKWCLSNQGNFRAPPLKAIADFLLYLFQERKLQPCTIGGYRSTIADKLGTSPINVSKDENLTRLLDSFHRDRPKGRRGISSWNLSLVLHR